MRVAVVGASHWHLPLFAEPLLVSGAGEIVGVADPDAAAAAAIAARFGCAHDSDFRALCGRVRPDFVLVLGRHVDMPTYAEHLLTERIPFTIEKPAGLNAAAVARLVDLEAKTGGFAAVPLVLRNSDFAHYLQGLPQGIDAMTFRFIAGFPARYRANGSPWMLDPAQSGGGCTINLAVHFIDLCRMLWGEATVLRHATMSNAAWGLPIEDYSALTLSNGRATCVIETGYLYPGPTSQFDLHFAIRGSEQYIVVRDQQSAEILDDAGNSQTVAMRTTNVPNYAVFITDVLDRVQRGARPLAGLSDLLPAMELIDQSYRLADFAR